MELRGIVESDAEVMHVDVELQAEDLASQTIDFEEAELLWKDSKAALRVRGTAPCLNMDVVLVPVRYVMQPDYWAIHVIGRLRGVCLEAVRPYDEVLYPVPMGKQGVVVVGETTRQKLEKPL